MSKIDRQKIREMFDGRCAYCGTEMGEKFHMDHVEPIYRTGLLEERCRRPQNDRQENIFPSCAPCNLYKGGFPLEYWRTLIGRLPDTLSRCQASFRHAVRFGLIHIASTEVTFHFEKDSTIRKVET